VRSSARAVVIGGGGGGGCSVLYWLTKLGYVPADVAPGRAAELDVFGEWVPGVVAVEPLFDPAGERIRA
jgi:hypothetical protein